MQIEVDSKKNRKSLEQFAASVSDELRLDRFDRKLLISLRSDVRRKYGCDGVQAIVNGIAWIQVQSTMNLDDIGRTICHEMTHVKQFFTGQMRMNPDGSRVWRGKTYAADTPYLQRPWEIDAMSCEVILYHRALQTEDTP